MIKQEIQCVLKVWGGPHSDLGRPAGVYPPCPCGCSPKWYLSGSEGTVGISMVLPDQETALIVASSLRLPIFDPENAYPLMTALVAGDRAVRSKAIEHLLAMKGGTE